MVEARGVKGRIIKGHGEVLGSDGCVHYLDCGGSQGYGVKLFLDGSSLVEEGTV